MPAALGISSMLRMILNLQTLLRSKKLSSVFKGFYGSMIFPHSPRKSRKPIFTISVIIIFKSLIKDEIAAQDKISTAKRDSHRIWNPNL
jgi:hypothetical protein